MSTAREAADKIAVVFGPALKLMHRADTMRRVTEIIETEYKHVEIVFENMRINHEGALIKKDEAIEEIQAFTRDLIKAAEGYINSHQHPVASFTHRIDTDKIDLINAITEAKKRS